MGSREPDTILPLTMDRNSRQRLDARKINDVSARRIAVLALCLCAVMCIGVVVYVHFEVKALSDEFSRHQINEGLNKSKEMSPRNIDKRSPPGKNSRKNKSHLLHYIHLVGKNNGRQHREMDYIYFTWLNSSSGTKGFELEGDLELGYYKIKIKHEGVYLVYAQVAVHGRDNVNKPYECSHQTVCTRKEKGRIVLLSSLITQYQLRGGRYEQNEENQGLRALDTTVHMGVFMLFADDVLSVQIPPNCDNMEYSMTSENSYFGLAQLYNINQGKATSGTFTSSLLSKMEAGAMIAHPEENSRSVKAATSTTKKPKKRKHHRR